MEIGIIGTGRIAARMADTMGDMCSAVYNPNSASAKRFGREHGIPWSGSDWDTFVDKVSAVYIASPHGTHEEYIRRSLSAGKHVLCEKPMAFSESSCRDLFALAEEKHLVLMEEMKTEDCPGFQSILADIRAGMIGEVVDVEATFTRLTPSCLRERTDTVFGGSFTELGSYGLLPVFRLLGCAYDDVHFQSRYDWNGIDVYTKAIFTYGSGRALKSATVKTGLGVKSEGQLLISGTSGYILVPSPWWLTRQYEIRYEDPNRILRRQATYEGTGLQYRLLSFLKRILALRVSESEDVEGHAAIDMETEKEIQDAVRVVTPEWIQRSKDEAVARASVFDRFLQENKTVRETMQWEKEETLKRISKPAVWAHRGLSLQYPENTLEAFRAAAELGPSLSGIETDVQLSKDGVVMIFYDETLDRVTDTKGNLRDFTFEELRRVKIMRHDGTYTQIPTLEEVLTLLKPYCEKNGLRLNIELKTSVYRYEGIEEKVLESVQKYGMEKYVVYSSFLMDSIRLMKELSPNVETGMLGTYLTDCIRGADQAHADSLHPWVYGINAAVPERYKGEKHAVRAWGGMEPLYVENTRKLMETHMDEAVLNGVTDIITNVPDQYC
jgi:predicted dehydrogenase/glycerophosphoryl diester phosphodiesterase